MNVTQYIYSFETKDPQGFDDSECEILLNQIVEGFPFEQFEKNFYICTQKNTGKILGLDAMLA